MEWSHGTATNKTGANYNNRRCRGQSAWAGLSPFVGKNQNTNNQVRHKWGRGVTEFWLVKGADHFGKMLW